MRAGTRGAAPGSHRQVAPERCVAARSSPIRPTGKLGIWNSEAMDSFQFSRIPEVRFPAGCQLAVDAHGYRQRACSVAHIGYGRTPDPDLHSLVRLVHGAARR